MKDPFDLNKLSDTPPWDWPRKTGEMLARVIRDRRAEGAKRILAAELAGDMTVMDEEMAELLLSVVEDAAEPDELRGKAAISLGPLLDETDTEGFDDALSDPPISEELFRRIQDTLHRLYDDPAVPKQVRRRVLESSVRAPQDWHADAIRTAYASDDEEWKLTATFGMRFIRGFGSEIMEMLESRNPEIHYEAVCAAGNAELNEAWSHVAALIRLDTEKRLLLAAIAAVGDIHPEEAEVVLDRVRDSGDEDIEEAVSDALLLAGTGLEEEDEDEEEDETKR